jgi:ribulose-phosphate 3-epimerase
LSADFARLAEEAQAALEGGATLLHVDVMDGHFVPNITIGPPVVKSLRRATDATLDVHLMIENPDQYVPDFVDAGADWISVHQEACRHLHRTLELIRHSGAKPGVVINPATPVQMLDEVLEMVDHVLVMSVNPGYGGQSYLPASTDKIRRVRALLDRAGSRATLEVDGGITTETIAEAWGAGADTFVAGTAVFGAPDPAQAVRELQRRCAVLA